MRTLSRISDRCLCRIVLSTWAIVTLPLGSSARADVHWNGLYHNNTNLGAETEIVPAELSPGETNRFLEIDYGANHVSFFFLTDHPAADGSVSCRVRLYNTSEGEAFEAAQWRANVVLTNTVPFHGTPVSGIYTVEVWQASWQPPNGFTGDVYYAPQVLENGGSDIHSLVRDSSGGVGGEWGDNSAFWQTNAQYIGDGNPGGVDYSFQWTSSLPLDYDGFYFNSTNVSLPQDEAVPGVPGATFFDYSYDADTPSYVYTLAPRGGLASARTRFWFGGGPGEVIRDAEWFANVEIGATNQFHGFPVSGTATIDVWRTSFHAPANWGTGAPHVVYYATELTIPKNGKTWMAANHNNAVGAVNVTNDWPTDPQLFTSYAPADGRDWNYTPTAAMARAQSLQREWSYHNNTALDAQLETVPDMGAIHFVDVDYAGTTTTFYAMLDNPNIALVPGESVRAQVRVYSPDRGVEWLPMAWTANVSLQSGAAFHGAPAAGSKTLDVWKAEWLHPTNALGAVTNQFDVYYAFLLESLSGSGEYVTDGYYLTASVGAGAGWGTNNYPVNPQLYGPDYTSHDYSYSHQWRDEGDDDGDGMPNWWEAQYLGGKTNGLPDGNHDTDALTNLEEWVADTLPNDSGSVYRAVITNLVRNGNSVTIQADAQTSTRRVYDLMWKTNLMDTTWTPVGLNLPGNYDGSAVDLTVSGDAGQIFYRSSVTVP